MNLEECRKEFVPLIDKEIKRLIPDSHKNLYDGMNYAFDSGGKRLRSVLCLAVCKSLGGDIEKALPFAVAIEYIHNFTLIHDDIEDGDVLRRGKQTVWKKYGIAHGINIGDGMVLKAYESLLNSKLPEHKIIKLSKLFTDSVMKIIEGQSMDFNFRNSNIDTKEYMEMVWRKTGVLFAAALTGAAMIADADHRTIISLEEYGKGIGAAFQIRDDMLNLIGKKKKYGKEIGSDIKEGKKTLIIIHCLVNCKNGEKKRILQILSKGRENVNRNDIKFVINTVKKYGSVEFSQYQAEKLAKEAIDSLNGLNRELKGLLNELADFVYKRNF